MKKTHGMILLLLVAILLAGCAAAPLEVEGQAIPENGGDQEPSDTAATAADAAPVADTAQQINILSAWNLYDPYEPSIENLLSPADAGYALDQDWQIASIDYVYRWWGLAEPVVDYQHIEATTDGYFGPNGAVDPNAVAALLGSLRNLHPTQQLVGGNAWTDDYPFWQIELTGSDGRTLLVSSFSTGNPGAGPWNVLDNGRLYAQYDGNFAPALFTLFEPRAGDPGAVVGDSGRAPGIVAFSTAGWPTQLRDGWSGLLPIADTFEYWADLNAGALRGFIEGGSVVSEVNGVRYGATNRLNALELLSSDGTALSCTLTPLDVNIPQTTPVWQFECPVPAAAAGQPYSYAIRILFADEAGAEILSTGRLYGLWGETPDMLLQPPSEALQTAVAVHPPAQDLLSDHVLVFANYSAGIIPESPLTGTLHGEAVLLGQREINGQTLRYSAGLEFVVTDGTLTHWGMDRAALDALLIDVANLPLTARLLAADPDMIINLWYADAHPQITLPELALFSSGQAGYGVDLASCGARPAANLPAEGSPMRAFGYDSSWAYSQPDFILVAGQPVAAALDLWPRDYADENSVRALLVPQALASGDLPPFERVWFNGNDAFQGQTELILWAPEDVDPAPYEALVTALPFPVDTSYGAYWEAYNLDVTVTDAGLLEITACSP